jgi:hypothetical protein
MPVSIFRSGKCSCLDNLLQQWKTILREHAQWNVNNTKSVQTKDYTIGISCFSAKHAALRRESKDWLGRNQNNVSEWRDMAILVLLFQ